MTYRSPRLERNNFHLLRMVFALVVCMYHAFELSHFPTLAWIPRYFSPDVAVNSFFVISGFLITGSFDRSTSVPNFFKRRFFRIYPAYFLVVLACAIGFFAISQESSLKYFGAAWAKYLLANFSLLNFVQPTLPGVFTENVFPTVNGSLWTIKVEAFLYVTVPILSAAFSKRRIKAATIFAYLCAALLTTALSLFPAAKESWICHEISRELTSPLSYFLAGALIYRHLEKFEYLVTPLVASGIVCLAIDAVYPLPMIAPIALAAVLIFAALFCYVGNFEKFGDFSYGIYILHFPIAQIFLRQAWPREHPGVYVFAVVCTAVSGAILLWHLVEKRCLPESRLTVKMPAAFLPADRE